MVASPQGGLMAVSNGLKVVVAEDDALVALSLRGQLSELGHHVVGEARNGVEAVQLAAEVKPDVILMDVKMPEMDGLTASKEIMEQTPTAIVILTSYADDAFVRAADLVGVMNYLVKPVDEKELAPALRIAHSRCGTARLSNALRGF
jgi:two-component system, response regulator PdtaR